MSDAPGPTPRPDRAPQSPPGPSISLTDPNLARQLGLSEMEQRWAERVEAGVAPPDAARLAGYHGVGNTIRQATHRLQRRECVSRYRQGLRALAAADRAASSAPPDAREAVRAAALSASTAIILPGDVANIRSGGGNGRNRRMATAALRRVVKEVGGQRVRRTVVRRPGPEGMMIAEEREETSQDGLRASEALLQDARAADGQGSTQDAVVAALLRLAGNRTDLRELWGAAMDVEAHVVHELPPVEPVDPVD